MAGETNKEQDGRKRMALIIVGVVVALVAIAAWLSGRKGVKDSLSYDNLRRMILGDDQG